MIRLFQYVYGVTCVKLSDVSSYSINRIPASDVDENTYVGVDNLIQDRLGKESATHIPYDGSCIKYNPDDILVGNIRPYLKKIWISDSVGGTNGDVLVIEPEKDKILPRFLYYVLSSDKFFAYDIQHSKGAKMPRGNKDEIMNYSFLLPTLDDQKKIVSMLNQFDSLCSDLTAGIPAEIEARQKQYEYYRDKLLTFKPKAV